jgi:methyl-accepting chemotaxis protein
MEAGFIIAGKWGNPRQRDNVEGDIMRSYKRLAAIPSEKDELESVPTEGRNVLQESHMADFSKMVVIPGWLRAALRATASFGGRLFSLIPSRGKGLTGIFKRSGADEPEWKKVLRELVQGIDDMNRSTEEQFLTLGSRLQSLYQDVKEISKIAETAAELMSGDRITTSIDGLRHVLTRVEYLESESQRHAEMLKQILETLDAVSLSLTGFQKFVQKLNVFCTTTRIESARLGDSNIGFDTLADDIKKLAGSIESKCSNILKGLDTLGSLIRQNLSKVLQAETMQRGQTRTILDQTQSGLTSLIEKHDLSLSTARHISTQYTELSRLMGEIVQSIQFHDITRQQIEHVAQALRVMSEVAPSAFEPSNLADVCDLQTIQLRHASQELNGAVTEIVSDLHAVAERIVSMTHESMQITDCGNEAGKSFLCSMEGRLFSISAVLHEYGEVRHDVSDAMNQISGAIEGISSFVSEIERTGFAIKLIALNAIVKAAHIGEQGAAFGVLADAIHHLSFDTDSQTRLISDTFESITVSAKQLAAKESSEDGELVESADQLAMNLDRYKSTLGEANESLVSQMAFMDKAEKKLLQRIEISTAGIDVHKKVADISADVASELQRLVTDWRGLAPGGGEPGNEEQKAKLLKALEESYTMNSERQVHHSVAGSRTPESSGSSRPHTESRGPDEVGEDEAEEDFGDNVELF